MKKILFFAMIAIFPFCLTTSTSSFLSESFNSDTTDVYLCNESLDISLALFEASNEKNVQKKDSLEVILNKRIGKFIKDSRDDLKKQKLQNHSN